MIDLHMHTVYSDGDKTVEELLKLCEEQKLEYISITDHDNCRAYDELKHLEIEKFYKDIILIYNGDNQGKPHANKVIFDYFFDLIVDDASDTEISEDKDAAADLKAYTDTLKLSVAEGEKTSPFAEKINGVTYELEKNAMGIKEITFNFDGDKGTMKYINEQGKKELVFRMCENEYLLFPQTGYSNEIGSVSEPGHQYKCAASAAWIEDQKLQIKVQIIDTYFGNIFMNFGFKDDEIGVYMEKAAEYFLTEYKGFAAGRVK